MIPSLAILACMLYSSQAVPLESNWLDLKPAQASDSETLVFNPFKSQWEAFKKNHGKFYETVEEDVHRFKVFLKNLDVIDKHNKLHDQNKKSFRLGVDEYADLEHAEFVQVMNGFKRRYNETKASDSSSYLSPSNIVSLPQNVDWRKEGYVTPVKNQGQCGSCWSFSTTGSLEGQHFKQTGKLVSLSEQNLVDCSTAWGNSGCSGGLMDQAFQYIKDNKGIDMEVDYPYDAKDEKCHFKRKFVGANDTGYVDVPKGDEVKLKEAIATIGPISVAIDASHQSFQLYHSGVYDEEDCSSTQLDHGVLAIGYGTNDEGIDYYIVKNSWGETWGQKGYIMMSRNKENQCGIASSASYPLV
jgi:cathepsin L